MLSSKPMVAACLNTTLVTRALAGRVVFVSGVVRVVELLLVVLLVLLGAVLLIIGVPTGS